MKQVRTVIALLVLTIASVALALTAVSAAGRSIPVASGPRVDFGKEVSQPMPQAGETVTFRLRFGLVKGYFAPVQARMSDPNPAPLYLEILTPTITGGAWYSPTIEGVVWEDVLIPGDDYEISFQVRVVGLPDLYPVTGYVVTNTATIADLRKPGTLPEQMAQVAVRLGSPRLFLPWVARDSGG